LSRAFHPKQTLLFRPKHRQIRPIGTYTRHIKAYTHGDPWTHGHVYKTSHLIVSGQPFSNTSIRFKQYNKYSCMLQYQNAATPAFVSNNTTSGSDISGSSKRSQSGIKQPQAHAVTCLSSKTTPTSNKQTPKSQTPNDTDTGEGGEPRGCPDRIPPCHRC
jgi:hypothetical protein